ncbi:hypothetical protein RBSWK_06260 [Rhodopirellula baltica SWK14]|uniref:Uncharacterized protein n=1 Tax=Rhodopirellula baltica SWK14 TaxID=993516 RepID=L7C6I4_RHOBT|nr:hypothetical protein RBSWK_06260 [Rhodopirellula baltica SWK14]
MDAEPPITHFDMVDWVGGGPVNATVRRTNCRALGKSFGNETNGGDSREQSVSTDFMH